jgi:uncharacterized membrane-anchored protein
VRLHQGHGAPGTARAGGRGGPEAHLPLQTDPPMNDLPDMLPPDDPLRRVLHDEVHARPPALIAMPALVVLVAVLHDGISRDEQLAHLQRLPGQQGLTADDVGGNYRVLQLPGCELYWERHTEFTRYMLVQPLPAGAAAGASDPDLLSALAVDLGWLRDIPGRTLAAVKLALVQASVDDPHAALAQGRLWFGERPVVASLMGGGHSCVVTDFHLRASGYERMLVLAPAQTTVTRAGRIAQRLIEFELYRLMALRGLPVAKSLGAMIAQAESELSLITAQLEDKALSDQALLDRLTALAVRVERATAEHGYRFAATRAYHGIVRQRIDELREKPIPGTQTVGEFMQRRLSPAIATVDATAHRLAALSQRVERTGALLRTRVDIATEAQNHQLLAKLTRGQELQLQLQTTVEGLSIAAISYYVVSLLTYAAKAAQKAGMPMEPELAVGVSIPLVLWVVWRTVRRIHASLSRRG